MADEVAQKPKLHSIAIEAFGVPVVIGATSPELLPLLEPVLPPGWRRRSASSEDDQLFALTTRDGITYYVEYTGDGDNAASGVSGSSDIDIALEVFDARLRAHIALNAPEHIFVHAGVVGHEGRAIVIPGVSFSGKTTLVAELVRAGAIYYSDEYAVLDRDGQVHPYPKPLSIRMKGFGQVDHDVALFGGSAGDESLPIGLVVATEYRPDAHWQPRELSAGEAALALLANTVPAQERPEQALESIKQAIDGAVAIEGPRGEAADIVQELLNRLSRS